MRLGGWPVVTLRLCVDCCLEDSSTLVASVQGPRKSLGLLLLQVLLVPLQVLMQHPCSFSFILKYGLAWPNTQIALRVNTTEDAAGNGKAPANRTRAILCLELAAAAAETLPRVS